MSQHSLSPTSPQAQPPFGPLDPLGVSGRVGAVHEGLPPERRDNWGFHRDFSTFANQPGTKR
jgi:hypothetical protein